MNPNRPTSTGTLVLLGVVGGLALAVYLFVTGQADTEREAANMTSGLGRMAFGSILLASGAVGGFAALRRKWRP